MLTDEKLQELAERLWREMWLDKPLGGWTLVLAMQVARAVEREARREALEEAAALATKRTKQYTDFTANWHVAADCAAAIRALT